MYLRGVAILLAVYDKLKSGARQMRIRYPNISLECHKGLVRRLQAVILCP